MSNVIDETGGLLSQFAIEEGVASKRADELLQRYEANGIDGLFSAFENKKQPILIETQAKQKVGGTQYFDFKG
jgi:hypothetical protein